MAGAIKKWRMPVLRGTIPDGIRKARLLAARQYRPGTIPRRSILGGYWDEGAIVRRFI